MDRNNDGIAATPAAVKSLSARRAWIEMLTMRSAAGSGSVALRKESVDRNNFLDLSNVKACTSLSARRAWIEIIRQAMQSLTNERRSPQGERG